MAMGAPPFGGRSWIYGAATQYVLLLHPCPNAIEGRRFERHPALWHISAGRLIMGRLQSRRWLSWSGTGVLRQHSGLQR